MQFYTPTIVYIAIRFIRLATPDCVNIFIYFLLLGIGEQSYSKWKYFFLHSFRKEGERNWLGRIGIKKMQQLTAPHLSLTCRRNTCDEARSSVWLRISFDHVGIFSVRRNFKHTGTFCLSFLSEKQPPWSRVEPASFGWPAQRLTHCPPWRVTANNRRTFKRGRAPGRMGKVREGKEGLKKGHGSYT